MVKHLIQPVIKFMVMGAALRWATLLCNVPDGKRLDLPVVGLGRPTPKRLVVEADSGRSTPEPARAAFVGEGNATT